MTRGDYRVGIVCLGNICRSPMAEVVLPERLDRPRLDDRVVVDSCGLGGWHVGNPMDSRAAATLTAAGYDASRHRARRWPRAGSTRTRVTTSSSRWTPRTATS